jgi:hypothetical protein
MPALNTPENYNALLEHLVAGRSAFVLGARHGAAMSGKCDKIHRPAWFELVV